MPVSNTHTPDDTSRKCKVQMLPIRDALDLLHGKWKIPIIVSLTFGNKRFREMQREIEGVSPKMLSKELKELELNELVKRTVYDTLPVTVEYSLTAYGESLRHVIHELYRWGQQHRKRLMKK